MVTLRKLLMRLPDEGIIALSYLLDISPGSVRMRLDDEADASLVQKFLCICERRKKGEPLQYILGRWDFYGRTFLVDPRALIPRPETEGLVAWLIEEDLAGCSVLDIGTGSGIIPVTLALETSAVLYASDISNAALSLAKENAKRFGVGDCITWIESDLFSNVSQTFDYIISNPPYVGEKEREELSLELSYEPENALFAGFEGLDLYPRLIEGSRKHLRKGGSLFLEIGASQGDAICRLLFREGFTSIQLRNDLTGRNRYIKAVLGRDNV